MKTIGKVKRGDVFFDACGDSVFRYTVTRGGAGCTADRVEIGLSGRAIGEPESVELGNPPGLYGARWTLQEALDNLERCLLAELDSAASHAKRIENEVQEFRRLRVEAESEGGKS